MINYEIDPRLRQATISYSRELRQRLLSRLVDQGFITGFQSAETIDLHHGLTPDGFEQLGICIKHAVAEAFEKLDISSVPPEASIDILPIYDTLPTPDTIALETTKDARMRVVFGGQTLVQEVSVPLAPTPLTEQGNGEWAMILAHVSIELHHDDGNPFAGLQMMSGTKSIL
jgi:hypothetical protein